MTNSLEKTISDALLTVRELSVNFAMSGSESTAVADVSFVIDRNEVLAIVGESGSGKSVSSLAILGLLPPNARMSGQIEFDGINLLTLTSEQMRRIRGNKIAMIFQEPMTALDPIYTVGEQLIEAIRAHRRISKDDAHRRALELLNLVKLPDPERRMDHYPHQLSGGQLQRIVIAMSVSCDPDLLIADEPTTALDVTVQAEILELLRDLGKRLNASVLFITHDMGVVADLADRVVVMRDGRIVEEASVSGLFTSPKANYTRQLLESVPHLGKHTDSTQPVPSTADNSDEFNDSKVLVFENIDITYRGRRRSDDFKAIDNVSFDVNRGEVVG